MKQLFSLRLQIPAIVLIFIFLVISCKNSVNDLATVITAEISNKTPTAALGGGEVTDAGGSPVTARGVCWSVYQNPTIADSKTSDGEGMGIFTSYLDSLTPGIVYTVRAYATNSAGTAYGSEISFIAGSSGSGAGFFTDERDGHVYRTQIIGHQTWMAENLAYLPEISAPDTGSLTFPHYYVYGYDSTLVEAAKEYQHVYKDKDPSVKDSFKVYTYKTYGALYNWPAAKASCPAGWHMPSEAEWKTLVETIGPPAGGKLKETGRKLNDSDTTHWLSLNVGATNSSCFGALPGGIRYSQGSDSTILEKFRYINRSAVFWSSTIQNDANTWAWHLYYDKDIIERDWFSNSNGFSVRCLKN